MLDYTFINKENLEDLNTKIELAERKLQIQKMSESQLQEELQIAQRELANLQQKQIRLKEAIEEKEMKEYRKNQIEADKKAARGVAVALLVMTGIVEEIGAELKKCLKKSNTKPDKILLSPEGVAKTPELSR